jgi:hypothetical protein
VRGEVLSKDKILLTMSSLAPVLIASLLLLVALPC